MANGDVSGMRSLELELVKGAVAPHYHANAVHVHKVVITEQGTQSRLPLVDFVGTLPDGTQSVFTLTGREVLALAACLRGANLRNHGVAEP